MLCSCNLVHVGKEMTPKLCILLQHGKVNFQPLCLKPIVIIQKSILRHVILRNINILNKALEHRNQQYTTRIIHYVQVGFHPGSRN